MLYGLFISKKIRFRLISYTVQYYKPLKNKQTNKQTSCYTTVAKKQNRHDLSLFLHGCHALRLALLLALRQFCAERWISIPAVQCWFFPLFAMASFRTSSETASPQVPGRLARNSSSTFAMSSHGTLFWNRTIFCNCSPSSTSTLWVSVVFLKPLSVRFALVKFCSTSFLLAVNRLSKTRISTSRWGWPSCKPAKKQLSLYF